MNINMTAILLAAGLSRRMCGQDKLLLPYRGKALLQRAVELLDALPCREKILVTTPPRLDSILLPPGVHAVINPCPEGGQSTSLRLGLGLATGEWFVFLAADQPGLTIARVLPLLELAKDNPDKIICPTVNGVPCSPTVFPARFRAELLRLTGDTGGRAIRAAHPEDCLSLETVSPEEFMDIDNPEDYNRLLQS